VANMELGEKRIIVIVSGGIAAYKSADLVRRLRKEGAQVRVVMTRAAREFVAPLTFETLSGHAVYGKVFERPASHEVEHISWAKWAEAVVVAPATANLLAKMALGIADDAATSLLLAYRGPLWVAPAMNTAMLTHPATLLNMATLRQRGARFMEPESGPLACGESGPGRLADPETIVRILKNDLAEGIAQASSNAVERSLAGKTVLITAGPTREMLDPIRFLSNRSSGRMGTALAAQAVARGARVILVHGPMAVSVAPGVELVEAPSAREMMAAVQKLWSRTDIAVFAAAVADYESARPAVQKLKGGQILTLELKRTPDIAAWAGRHRREGQILVGFAAESQDLAGSAKRKLREKKLDMICANAIGIEGVGFESDTNQVLLLRSNSRTLESPRAPKTEVAAWIWDRVVLFDKDSRTNHNKGRAARKAKK
jgi:phosphopantothenoylcysteine decarboxylase / phosphopantothenate---cysteine ligase